MNKIAEEILECMLELIETDDKKLRARFIFPDKFIGFQGHFPEKKILPGICKIQAVIIMLETYYKRKVRLKEITQAKYFAPVSSGDELIFECQLNVENGEEIKIKALITCNNNKIAVLQLEACLNNK